MNRTKNMRLLALDGLRGIAVLLVILNHIPLKIWYTSTNPVFHRWLDILVVNGKVGVAILFLLTGFLMAWLYPNPKTKVGFWAKRYARLFPAFLVMVTSWTIIKIKSDLLIVETVGVVLGVGLIARGLWQLGLKISKKINLGKYLTYFWIFFQIGTALWYLFYLLKIPSPIFYQNWDKNWQWIITAVINGTLTLPFGNYIGQLDGVYWSLITETLFYILYPVLFVPIFAYVNKKKGKIWKIILLASSFLFCYILGLVSQRILWMSMMIPSLMIYFVAGVVIGSKIDWWKGLILKLPKIFLRPWFLMTLMLLSLGGVFLYPLINKSMHPWIQMIQVIPLAMLVIMATLDEKITGKIWENKILVFLGKYSYALYLTHALVIDLAVKVIKPVSIANSFWLVTIVLLGSIGLSWCLYHLIESPYYRLPKKQLNWEKEKPMGVIKKEFKKTWLVLTGVILIILIIAFKTPFSIMSYSYFHKSTNKELWVSGGESVSQELVAKENNLGMITTNIKIVINNKDEESKLVMKLKNDRGEVISESSFDMKTMIENRFYPFGFPIQLDSKNKKYVVSYEINPKTAENIIKIDQKENQLISVYSLNKREILKNPKMAGWWLGSKIREPLVNQYFWWYLLGCVPLFLGLMI